MQEVIVPFRDDEQPDESMAMLSLWMDALPKQSIGFTPWPGFPYKPEVAFSIAYSTSCILLKYFVDEKSIKAAASDPNGKVWEDACVEFFISFDDTGYYNIEFNCIGTGFIGFGKSKDDRVFVPEEEIKKIKFGISINNENKANIHWELTLRIPLTVFAFHKQVSIKGKRCTANFYKCGDGLDEPHFLAWSNITAPQPDFHLPQFFGKLFFEE